MSESRSTLRINLGKFDLTIVGHALDQITERINQSLGERICDLVLTDTTPKNNFDKCSDCVWFHKTTNFCAVAPQNLTSSECGDHQLPELPTNLDYLEARSPERITLVQELATKLEIDFDELEHRLYQGWAKHPEDFGMTTRGLLLEVEKYGGYSIAQIELIGDGIRLQMDDAVPCLIASAIRKKVLAGRSFDEIMYWLVL